MGINRPHIRIRLDVGKGHKGRTVPLWWDAGTLRDLAAWKSQRETHGAGSGELYVCSLLANQRSNPLSRHSLRLRFQRACRSRARTG